jgi:hypothetical protein
MELGAAPGDGAVLDVRVAVSNLNTGHALPSGARFAREVWVELTAIDTTGAAHVVSGALDADGSLRADPQRIELGDRVTHGSMAAVPFEADHHEVHALAAGERRTYTLRVPRSWAGAAIVGLRARLRYRRNTWALRRTLGLGNDSAPVLELAHAEVVL